MKLTPETAQVIRHALNRLNRNEVEFCRGNGSDCVTYKITYSLRRKVELNCQIEVLSGQLSKAFNNKIVRDNYLKDIVKGSFFNDCKIIGTHRLKLVNIFIKNGKSLISSSRV